MKTIRSKIMTGILASVILVAGVLGAASALLNYAGTLDTLEQMMSQSVQIAANQVSSELDSYKMLAREMSANVIVTSGTASKDQKSAELRRLAETHGFLSVSLVGPDGVDIETGQDLSGYPFIAETQRTGEPFLSDPMVMGEDVVIYICAPVMKEGKFGGAIAIRANAQFLSDIVSSIHIGSGNAAILNSKGDTIGFADMQLVRDAYNTQVEAKSDSSLERLAEIEAEMSAGHTGVGMYYYGGKEKMMAYCPVPGTNGWSIDVAIVRNEFMTSAFRALYATAALAAVAVALAAVYSARVAGSIAGPIRGAAERLRLMTEGDLTTPVPATKARDETRLLLDSLQSLTERLNNVIREIGEHLGAIAAGDLTRRARRDYLGDFRPLSDAMRIIDASLGETIGRIDEAAVQVAVGSEQVSAGAQALSQGTTEQAGSIEELAATVAEISGRVEANAQNAAVASEKAAAVGRSMQSSNEQMNQMIEAIGRISESSSEIGKIIKTIEDIAFQTNILALNAAVEAARAGAAGKGFAVVADEVRSLANKSQEASKNTSVLIAGSIQAVEHGTHIAGETAQSLAGAVGGARETAEIIGRISAASREQAEALAQATIGVDQISAVVQQNSATAEQSAAASEQLSVQAGAMKGLVGKFRLASKSGAAAE